AKEIDLRKYTALPGLIDLHTHMTYYWNRDPATKARQPVTPRRTPAETADVSFENALRTLETGVTTVRHLRAAGRDQHDRPVADAGRGAGAGRVRLDQGLRIARQLRQRGHDTDRHP